jgi:hypothetical protein
MARQKTEAELLARAIRAFHDVTGIQLHEDQFMRADPRWKDVDARIRLETPHANRYFAVEVKRWLNAHTLGLTVQHLTKLPEEGLLVTEYANPNIADQLRNMGVAFMDTVGNAYVNAPPVFIYMRGQKAPPKPLHDRQTRTFAPAGLKVVFALLCRQDLVVVRYRAIAEAAGVALGTVAWVLDDLQKLGHLLEVKNRERKLIEKRRLLDRWVAAYPEQLRPKLGIGRFAAPDPKWWEHARIGNFRAYWGGEVAAARLTKYLKPEVVTVYARDLPGRLLAANQLRKDERGNVEVLKAFWTEACDWADKEIVHPLLVYADLIATGDARNLETAKRLYDDQIIGLIGED